MKKKMYLQLITAVACAAMFSGLTGCQEKAEGATEAAITDQTFVSDVVSCTTNSPSLNTADANGLSYLREYMSYFTDGVIGVCYLGHREKGDTRPLADWIQTSAPQLVKKLPFILEIAADKERVLGDGYGDLFCFVPKDPFSTLSVNRTEWISDEYGVYPYDGDVLYRSEYAEPVLVFANYEQYWDESNVKISALSGSGGYVQWCPYRDLDNNGALGIPFYYKEDSYAGTYEAKLLVDFTHQGTDTDMNDPFQWNAWDYIQAIDPYDVMDDGWSAPYDTALMNTKWQCGENWYISFGEGNCDPAYAGCVEIYKKSEQGQNYQKLYSGVWRMDEEYLRLEVTSGSDTRNGSFLILISPSGEEMDMYMDYRTGVIPPFFIEGTGFMTLTYRYE